MLLEEERKRGREDDPIGYTSVFFLGQNPVFYLGTRLGKGMLGSQFGKRHHCLILEDSFRLLRLDLSQSGQTMRPTGQREGFAAAERSLGASLPSG